MVSNNQDCPFSKQKPKNPWVAFGGRAHFFWGGELFNSDQQILQMLKVTSVRRLEILEVLR